MTRHVVFGTGQVGRPLVEHLARRRARRRRRQPRRTRSSCLAPTSSGVTRATRAFTTRICAGADVVYFCLNARNYGRWDEEFPPLQRGVLTGATRAGARLVVLDNLYAYGPPNGRAAGGNHVREPDVEEVGHPGSDDRGTAARPRRGAGGGRHRPRQRLLRPRRTQLRARRDSLRHRPDRSEGAGHG